MVYIIYDTLLLCKNSLTNFYDPKNNTFNEFLGVPKLLFYNSLFNNTIVYS